MTDSLHVAITGASSGLGRALAAQYAKSGALLSLCGRNEERLTKSLDLCSVFKPEIRTSLFDVRDEKALQNWITTEDAFKPIDLIFANAGVSYGVGEDSLEDPKKCMDMFQINTEAAILTAIHASKVMVPRHSGQIVLISSQAGRIPLVNTPGYSASKAALRYYGLAMRDSLSPKGVKLTVVCPGYIESPMKDSFEGYTPFTWSSQKAASYIAEKLTKDPALISFPLIMNLMVHLYGLLPGFIQRPLNKKFSFTVKNLP
ncbi:MAG: SDR family NAD(P)-dependent oxidoreductase [Deltaproteobacteria bacterium]|jgi:short-subunit dehydrogenase|nr:SDR family NAD(P)-dependent oxidoreductase [Deltaproteobacteria bacterium]